MSRGASKTPPGLLFVIVLLWLQGCSMQAFQPGDVSTAPFIDRALVQQQGPLLVHAAVPGAREIEAITQFDLYEQGIQPVWLRIENTGDHPARVTLWSIDSEYFSPVEVAFMNRRRVAPGSFEAMQQWFYRSGLEREIPPGETREGFVYTNFKEGTKGFNIDVFSARKAYHFTFFVPLPGFTPDYAQVDFAALYSPDQQLALNLEELKSVLESDLPCCTSDAAGEKKGGPLNVVMVGSPLALRRSLLRGGWKETEKESADRMVSTRQHYLGRPPDTVFQLDREGGKDHLTLHMWLSPYLHEGQPVWVGQVYYSNFGWLLRARVTGETAFPVAVNDERFKAILAKNTVTADVDSAQRFLLQNLWYNQSLSRWGIVEGVGESTADKPQSSFGGAVYFTQGWRFVLWLSEVPVALDETTIVFGRDVVWRRQADEH
jgi:LssY C-terminus